MVAAVDGAGSGGKKSFPALKVFSNAERLIWVEGGAGLFSYYHCDSEDGVSGGLWAEKVRKGGGLTVPRLCARHLVGLF